MSLQVDRIVFADLGQPAAIAHALLKQNPSLPIPIPIEELAVACGITSIDDVNVKSFEGALIAPDHKESGQILVRTPMWPERRRFTIGHELGHFLNLWHIPPNGRFECSSRDMRADPSTSQTSRTKWEGEANIFAIEVLIPRDSFIAKLRKIKQPGLEHIVELSAVFQTSKLATARRFRELSDNPCAIIQTKDLNVDCLYRNGQFPFISLQHGQTVHRKTLTATFAGAVGDCSDMEETEASYWTDSPAKAGCQMFEQVLSQEKGYLLTLLTLDSSSSELEDDEDAYVSKRSAWSPSFKR